MRGIFEALREAMQSHACWEVEAGANILHSRRKILLLVLLTLPIFAVSTAEAVDALPRIIGGKEAYGPAFFTTSIFIVAILVGFCTGLVTGCIGAGGGFIITPALMSAGIKGILAVGTDLFHIFAKAIMGTVVHKKLGNISVGLGAAFLVGSFGGVMIGGRINRALYELNPVWSDIFISALYVLLLGFLGFYSLADFLRQRRQSLLPMHAQESRDALASGGRRGRFFEWVRTSRIPPVIVFDRDQIPGGKRISALFVAVSGALVGLVAAIMGVGGGFITFPMFVYVLGVSSFTAVGTDILQIIFTAGFASISQYAIYGFVFYTLAMGMLLGSLIGVQLGAMTTRVVKGIHIRAFYAMAILAGFVNRLFALPGKLCEAKILALPVAMVSALDMIGNVLFFACVGAFSFWVVGVFIWNIKVLREDA